MSATLHPVDMASEPFLSGRFAPVTTTRSPPTTSPSRAPCPPTCTAHYVRNGPNPEFPPLGSYTYPLEGDGMVHGVWIEGGTARYANRWVRTQQPARPRSGPAAPSTAGS